MDRYPSIKSMLLTFLTIFFIYNTKSNAAEVTPPQSKDAENAIKSQLSNQVEQDKIRKEHLQNTAKKSRSSKQEFNKTPIQFPEESPCYAIDNVYYKKDNDSLNIKTLDYFTHQAQGKCLGVKGIKLLADVMQNEIIRLGYITTRINMPEQNLNSRELHFNIVAGKIGKIKLEEGGANYINLKTTLPLDEGDLLNLSDLEQGSFNLQRVPGSKVKINLVPGAEKGESDILIHREQDKFWQVGAWVNDAGSKTSGRYQAGAALYLNNITSLSDTFYVSMGHDIDTRHKPEGNSNWSIGYSIPWGYWWMDLYASHSRYKQRVQATWSDWMLNNKNEYYSLQLNRQLSNTIHQRTTAGLQIFDVRSRYYYENVELNSMHKHSTGWKAILNHQHYFNNAVVSGSLSYQKKMPWFNSASTLEQQQKVIDSAGRIITLNLQASMNFNLFNQTLNYSPYFMLQLSPDLLSTLDAFVMGNRWTVRGFDGESNLQENQGWYWRNNITWVLKDKNYQPYLGLDVGRVIGNKSQQYYSGKSMVGSVVGLRGRMWNTGYDLFAGTPLKKPQGFHTDPLTLGFSLQWKY
ncbi:ShlB/FhaC/HecB family hemolysin secretion/activation protein [Erwinia endophytica]|nr:ShlB/FhaC/HecB family hemolysin secretion/activation protein [Erwinia endophytica]